MNRLMSWLGKPFTISKWELFSKTGLMLVLLVAPFANFIDEKVAEVIWISGLSIIFGLGALMLLDCLGKRVGKSTG